MKWWAATVYGKVRGLVRHETIINWKGQTRRTRDPNVQAKNDICTQVAAQKKRPKKMMTGALAVFVRAVKKRPKGLAKRRHHATTQPDVDNQAKLFLDAFNEFVWKDDRQIVLLVASKEYGPATIEPHAEIAVLELDESEPAPSAHEILRMVIAEYKRRGHTVERP